MAITVTARGSAGSGSAANIQFTPGSNFGAQTSLAVLVIAYDNAGSAGIDPYSNISDTLGNTWTPRQNALYDPGAASAGVTLRIFTCPQNAGILTTSTIITIVFTNTVAAKAWALWEVAPDAGFVCSYVTGNVNTGAATGTPTVTTSSVKQGDCVIGGGGAESGDTWAGDADSSNGTWNTHAHAAQGTGATGMSVTSQAKIVTGTATQTYNPTLTSADCILAWIQITQTFPVASATETDTASACAVQKRMTMGAATEADSATACAVQKQRATGVATESDLAFARIFTKQRAIGAALEIDLAAVCAIAKQRAMGVAFESSFASALTLAKGVVTGLATEADSAAARAFIKVRAPGLASETDSANSLAVLKRIAAGLAAEADSALTVTLSPVILIEPIILSRLIVQRLIAPALDLDEVAGSVRRNLKA